MAFPQLESELYYGHCLHIRTPNKSNYYLQNFQIGDFLFLNNNWVFLPFEAENISNNLDLSNVSASIRVVNNTFIKTLIQTEIRNSRVTLYTVFPEDLVFNSFNGVISGYTIDKQVISVSISSPLDAISGVIPSTDFNPKDFPVLSYLKLDRQGKIKT